MTGQVLVGKGSRITFIGHSVNAQIAVFVGSCILLSVLHRTCLRVTQQSTVGVSGKKQSIAVLRAIWGTSTNFPAFGRSLGLVVEQPYRKVFGIWTGYTALWRAFGSTCEQALICSSQNTREISHIFVKHGIKKVSSWLFYNCKHTFTKCRSITCPL